MTTFELNPLVPAAGRPPAPPAPPARGWRSGAIVAALAATQVTLWFGALSGIGMRLEVVPPAPPAIALEAAAFGDRQALFRWRALELQTFGDSGGRSTPLRQFDYPELVRWFDALDRLDSRAEVVPTIAAFVFGQTTDARQLRLVIDYLARHAQPDPEGKMRWLAHAAMLAAHRLGDTRLALSLLDPIAKVDPAHMPPWVRMLPAFLHAKIGEREAALDLLRAQLSGMAQLAPSEQAYLRREIARLEHQSSGVAR